MCHLTLKNISPDQSTKTKASSSSLADVPENPKTKTDSEAQLKSLKIIEQQIKAVYSPLLSGSSDLTLHSGLASRIFQIPRTLQGFGEIPLLMLAFLDWKRK